VGERTRQLGGAHLEFAARIRNPVAVKLGPSCSPEDVLAIGERLDPEREPGRLTLVTRMGASRVRDMLPPLVEKATASGLVVSWVCDPARQQHRHGSFRPSTTSSTSPRLLRGTGVARCRVSMWN
jgi:3-deoxy-7-phosphoheptulonate synthase